MENFESIVKIVEQRREILKSSIKEIEIIDYGAGKPNDKRTKEEMQKGVKSVVVLKELASIGVKKEKAKQIYDIFLTLEPKTILELGTCLGFSSAYMGFFMPNAKIYTIEGSPNIAQIARENHQAFNLASIEIFVGRFVEVLSKLLEKIKPIDFAFIDGHHNKEATLAYFKQILPFMSGGGDAI